MSLSVQTSELPDPALSPAFLKLDLFCKGLRIDPSCELSDDAREIIRNRAGLGSGLELIIGDGMYTNVPVVEWWVRNSPYRLVKIHGRYEIHRDEDEFSYSRYETMDKRARGPFIEPAAAGSSFVATVEVPPEPRWYKQRTSSGKLMQRIGCLQGSYLGIYWGPRCQNWGPKGENEFCKFCTEGQNLGRSEEVEKSIDDVVETVLAARRESGITFVHFNTGFIDSNDYYGLFKDVLSAVKERTGLLVGLQTPPDADFANYRPIKELGVNNLSFCFEVIDEELFKEIGPGKARRTGLKRYLDAIDHTANEIGFDTVNGEIIAGLEPVESSIRAIDWIVDHGAIPTVCVFRPVFGAAYGDRPPPRVEEMLPIFRHFYRRCMEKGLPIGIAPNVKVSLIMLPEECRGLTESPEAFPLGRAKLWLMRGVFGALFNSKLKV